MTFLQPRIKLKEWEKDREGELAHLTQIEATSNPQNMLLIRQIPIILLIILGHTACGFSPDVQDIEEDILGLHTTARL